MPGIILLTHAPSGESFGLNSERIEDLKDVSKYEEFKDYWKEEEPEEGVMGAGIFMFNTRQLWVAEREDEVEERLNKLDELPRNRMVPVTDAVSGKSYRTDADSIELVAPMTLWKAFTWHEPPPPEIDVKTFIVADNRSFQFVRESPAEFARRVNNRTPGASEDSPRSDWDDD